MLTVRFERTDLPGEWYQRVTIDAAGFETRKSGDLFRPVRAEEAAPDFWDELDAAQRGDRVELELDGKRTILVAMTGYEEDALLQQLQKRARRHDPPTASKV